MKPIPTTDRRRAVPSNVVSLPRRRRRRKQAASGQQPCHVLQFTGTKRFVYDRGEVLEKWQTAMLERARDLLVNVANGKVTGLVIVTATGGPDGGGDGSRYLNAAGTFCEDMSYMVRTLDHTADVVAEGRFRPTFPDSNTP